MNKLFIFIYLTLVGILSYAERNSHKTSDLIFSTNTENELPCGKRRLFNDGAILNSTYDDSYHYLENGSVSMKPGFVAKPGFSIKPNLNCNQTKPALENLVIKHAPQIRHAKNENYHLSSVDWYMSKTRLSKSKIIRVPYCTIRICGLFGFGCYKHVNYQNGIDEVSIITTSVNDSNIIQHVGNGHITSLTKKQGNYNRSGYKEGAATYVRVRSLDHLNIPVFEGGIEIQYYYFYPWNGDQGEDGIPCTPDADHEADWESVGVILNKDHNVLGYTHSSHGNVYFSFASSVNKESQGHPILYSANESHAMYRKTGYNHPSAPFLDRCDNDGYHFNSWNEGKYEIINIDPMISSTAVFPSNPNWINFSGRWGSYPLGPVGPGPNGNKYFWNHRFESLHALADYLNVEISDFFGNYGADQQTQSTDSNPQDLQQLLDSINSNTYRFDNNPVLEGNEMNIYEGSVVQEDSSQLPGTGDELEPEQFTVGQECDQNFIDIQSISLTTELSISDCKISIKFDDNSYSDQLVKWKIIQGSNSYIFEQHKKIISFDYSSSESISLEVSAEYSQACDILYTGTTQVIIPSCQIATTNARSQSTSREEGLLAKNDTSFQDVIHVLYPNPTNGNLTIELNSSVKEVDQISVKIHDGLGRNVDDVSLSEISDRKLNVDLGKYEEGVYMISVYYQNELLLIRRIIRK